MTKLEEYKNYLIKSYVHEIDNTEDKILERQKYLEKNYSDDYLHKIILDTYKIIDLICQEKSNDYYNIKLEENNPKYISLNLTGGWHSDTMYEDVNGNLISEYILKKFFGNTLIIEQKIIEYEFDTEDPDILSFDYEYYLYMQGFANKSKNKQKIKK